MPEQAQTNEGSRKEPNKVVAFVSAILAPLGIPWAKRVQSEIEELKRKAQDEAKEAVQRTVDEAKEPGENK